MQLFHKQVERNKSAAEKHSYNVDYIIFDKDYTGGVTVSEDELFDNEEDCRRSIPIMKN